MFENSINIIDYHERYDEVKKVNTHAKKTTRQQLIYRQQKVSFKWQSSRRVNELPKLTVQREKIFSPLQTLN